MKKSLDAIVVGSGMVGSLAANLLLQQGLRIALVDRTDGQIVLSTPPAYDSRVSAISKHSQALLEQAGAWQLIDPARLTPYFHMDVWDGLGTSEIQFSSDDLHIDSLGHLVENSVLNQALLKSLEQYSDSLTCYFSESVRQIDRQQNQVTVELESGLSLTANTLVAADGANSFIRELFGFTTTEWDYQHSAIVATIEVDKSHQNTAWQEFGSDSILAFLPMPSFEGRHFISIVWSVAPAEAEELLALSKEVFCQRLGFAISSKFNVLGLHSDPIAIPLRQRHASQYVQEGIALIGDAAHTIHPLAGQGANLGFADAGALAEVLGHAKKRGDALASLTVLRRYQRLRMAENMRMAASMEFFRRLYAKQNPLQVMVRNLGMSWMNRNTWLKNHIVQMAVGKN